MGHIRITIHRNPSIDKAFIILENILIQLTITMVFFINTTVVSAVDIVRPCRFVFYEVSEYFSLKINFFKQLLSVDLRILFRAINWPRIISITINEYCTN